LKPKKITIYESLDYFKNHVTKFQKDQVFNQVTI